MNPSKFKKFLSLISVFLFVVFLFGVFVPESLFETETITYTIEKGAGTKKIASDLKKQGIIKSTTFFRFYALISGSYAKLQAGKYEMSPSMSIAQIIKKLFLGDVVKNKITVIEGWSIKDLAEDLEAKNIYSKEDVLGAVEADYSGDFSFLKDAPSNANLEGYIFPDTYYVSHGSKLEEFIKVALLNFNKKLTNDLRQEIAKQGKSVFQVITMASILEKEVRSLGDKKIVSGILWKRIKEGMPLQVDATVNYVTGKHNPSVSIQDTKIDSRYNTYKYYGLPQGPISNPGIESILAAIYPEESEYWYYLSADGNGQTIFSKTLDEHNIDKSKYLK